MMIFLGHIWRLFVLFSVAIIGWKVFWTMYPTNQLYAYSALALIAGVLLEKVADFLEHFVSETSSKV